MRFHPKRIVLKNIQFQVHLSFDREQREAAMRGVNQSVLGRPNCNILDGSQNIVRDPAVDDETDDYIKYSHHRIHGGLIMRIECDMTEDGEKVNFRFPKKIRRLKEVMFNAKELSEMRQALSG